VSAEQNVELARRMMNAHNGGPEVILARFDEFFHPELEWVPAIVGGLERASYRGRDGLARWYDERDETLDGASVEITSCMALSDDVVLILGRSLARGRASGAEVDEEVGIVLRFSDGSIRDDRAYGSHAEAREAAESAAA
jgi:ketosteroid isomerase-like protein